MENNIISGTTRICGIIGDPIEHTMSPVMHNAAFQKAGLGFVFVPFNVKPEELKQAIHGVRAFNIRGLSVTIPHKVAVIPFLDEVDSLAEKIGAVNTIVNEEKRLKGYNTDASGFLRALLKEGIQPEGKNVVILGAGGASRAIAFILADRGAELTIINRHLAPAQEMAGRIFSFFRKEVKALELNRENLKIALDGADIVVNTTSVGMSPNAGKSPVGADLLKPGLVVFDIIYNPMKTRLMAEAEKRGAKIISGVEMLVWQGVAAFELWTGKSAPVQVMRESAIRALSSK